MSGPKSLLVAIALLFGLVAQATAFDRSQWRIEARSNGTVFLTCISPACGTKTLVSFHAQKAGVIITAQDYQRDTRTRDVAIESALGVSIDSDRKQSMIVERRKGSWREFSDECRLTYPDGRRMIYVSGVLVGADRSWSVVSSATDARKAHRYWREAADELEAGRNPTTRGI